jgi:hypothetical protein
MTDRFDRNDRDPLAPHSDMLGFGFLIAGVAVLLHAYLPAIETISDLYKHDEALVVMA